MKKPFLLSFLLLFIFSALKAQNHKYEEIMDQDWANLRKYHKANENIQTNSPQPRVVFMGNSITEGWVNIDPTFFEEHNYVGRGISGQTTPQMLIRFIPDVIDLEPEAVVILAGTNDIAGNTGFSSVKMITDNIKAMAQLATANNIKVILASVLPAFDYPWRPGLEPVEKISEVNTWLQNYAQENDHVYLDYFSHMADERSGLRQELSGDGVHPNKTGYEVMKPLVQDAIATALN